MPKARLNTSVGFTSSGPACSRGHNTRRHSTRHGARPTTHASYSVTLHTRQHHCSPRNPQGRYHRARRCSAVGVCVRTEQPGACRGQAHNHNPNRFRGMLREQSRKHRHTRWSQCRRRRRNDGRVSAPTRNCSEGTRSGRRSCGSKKRPALRRGCSTLWRMVRHRRTTGSTRGQTLNRRLRVVHCGGRCRGSQ